MKKRILFVFLTFLVIAIKSYGQGNASLSSYIPAPSQTTTLTNSYGVDYYSGRLNYSAPLNSINISGITFPISLSYSTNGIKVQDIAGITGLGWAPSLGGSVTREVHGIPDEYYYGYSGANRTGGRNTGPLNREYMDKVSDGTWDAEPDKFYYSFLGFSGSFVMDPDGKPVLQSNQTGIRIDYCPFKRGQAAGPSKWVLRDQRGNQYFFEISQAMAGVVHGPVKNEYQNYTSAWYITRIVTSNNQQINFTYGDRANINYTNYLNVRRVDKKNDGTSTRLGCLGSKHTGDTTYNQNIDISYQEQYLTKISGNGTDINLAYNLSRADLNGAKALTDISINYNNRSVYSYKLNYGYFTSSDGSNTKRLKLSGISQVYPGNILKSLYSFYYNESVNLPARNSVKTDYLGYYNNNAQSSNIYTYSDKTPDLTNTCANILQKVTDLLGGSVNFEYELNRYYADNQNKTGAGLRVKRTYQKKKDSDSELVDETTFSYNLPGGSTSSGQLYSAYVPSWGDQCTVMCGSEMATIWTYSSEPLESVTDGNGVNVGYSSTTVQRADGSLTRYTLTNFSNYPDKAAFGSYATWSGDVTLNFNTQTSLTYGNYTSNIPKTSFAFARGKILKEELIGPDGLPLKETTYLYSLTTATDLVTGVKPHLWSTDDQSNNMYEIRGFSYATQDLRLDEKNTQFFKAGAAQQNTFESYRYTTYAPNIIKTITTTGSGGRADEVTFRYPFDIIPATPTTEPDKKLALTYMVYTNDIANPVEVIHVVSGNYQTKVVAVNITKYAPDAFNNIAPSAELKLEAKSPINKASYVNYKVTYSNGNEVDTFDPALKVFNIYSQYDANTNLLESKTNTLRPYYNSNILGYRGMYKIAEVSNATQANVAYTSFESTDKGNWSYIGAAVFDLSSVTGKKLYNLSKGSLSKDGLSAAETYVITYWTKNTTYYTIAGTQGTPLLLVDRNGWRCYKHLVTGQTNITIPGTGYIDEVRLHPLGSEMITYTYEPLVGMTSKTNENNQVTYYEYDEFNRLQYIRGSDKNIINAYCYNLNGEPGNCFITFANQAQSRSFYKNDCGQGIAGTAVTYQVPAGRYSAGSQQAANALAQIEIDQNGQDYANANASCSSLTLYAKIDLSNYTYDSWSSPNGEGGSTSMADVYIKFYSDAAGTVPYVVDRPVTVYVTEDFNVVTAYNGTSSGSNLLTYVVAAGQSSLSLGRHLLSSYGSYIDPYSGSGLIYESSDYSYNVIENGNDYVPLTTNVN